MTFRTKLTKTVDLRDVEVEIELDADDLEECTAEELVEALVVNNNAHDIASALGDHEEVLTALISGCDTDSLADMFDESTQKELCSIWLRVDRGTPDGLAESLRDTLLANDKGPFSVEALCNDMDPLYARINELTTTQCSSIVNHITAVRPEAIAAQVKVTGAMLDNSTPDDMVQALTQSGHSLQAFAEALIRTYGLAYTVSRIMEVALSRCSSNDKMNAIADRVQP